MLSLKREKPGLTLKSTNVNIEYNFEDHYRLHAKLSKGSFGIVYLSEHKATGEEYAVKVIERSELNDKEKSSVEREVSILRDFQDVKHIVQLVDYYSSPDRYYVVQQYAQGGDVFERLAQRTSYTEKDARDLAVHLLEAIEVLHSRKLAHRDLKPENLLLRDMLDDTSILVADFGFAAYVPADGLKTRCGTPAFVAPQILTPNCRYDERVDMWSVGCLLYMLIAGYPPFQDRNHRGLFRKVRGADFVFHDMYWKNVSVSAKQLISSMLTIDPRYRCTARIALDQSNWLKMDSSLLKAHDLAASLGEIKRFHARRTLKSALHKVVWSVKNKSNKSADDVILSNRIKGWDFNKNNNGQKNSLDNIHSQQQEQLEEAQPHDEYSNDYNNNNHYHSNNDNSNNYNRLEGSDSMLMTKIRTSLTFQDIYGLKTLLHTGQNAKVYECYHKKTRAIYAVKIIERTSNIDQETKQEQKSVLGRTLTETIIHEVAILDSLNHNNIISIQDFFEDDDNFYLVMERMYGGDVFDYIMKYNKYNEYDAKKLIKILLETVLYFHKQGITHRDLKPQNLLLKSNNDITSIKVADFGFACRVHTKQSLTTRCGTPSYVAPEVLKNVPYDQSADMWSVGVIMYVVLCGCPPFVDENQSELFRKIRTADWKFRGEEWESVSSEAKDLIKRLLVANPLQRYTAEQALKCKWFRLDGKNSPNNHIPESIPLHSNLPSGQHPINGIYSDDDEGAGLKAVEQVINKKEASEIRRQNKSTSNSSRRRQEELNGNGNNSKSQINDTRNLKPTRTEQTKRSEIGNEYATSTIESRYHHESGAIVHPNIQNSQTSDENGRIEGVNSSISPNKQEKQPSKSFLARNLYLAQSQRTKTSPQESNEQTHRPGKRNVVPNNQNMPNQNVDSEAVDPQYNMTQSNENTNSTSRKISRRPKESIVQKDVVNMKVSGERNNSGIKNTLSEMAGRILPRTKTSSNEVFESNDRKSNNVIVSQQDYQGNEVLEAPKTSQRMAQPKIVPIRSHTAAEPRTSEAAKVDNNNESDRRQGRRSDNANDADRRRHKIMKALRKSKLKGEIDDNMERLEI